MPIAETLSSTPPVFIRGTSEGEIRRFNALVGTLRSFPFTWAEKPAVLRFIAASAAPVPSGYLRLRLGDHSLDVGLPELPEPSSLGVAFAGIEIAALPEELLLGVLEAWLADPIAALQSHAVSLQLEAWQTTEPNVAATLGWELTWDGRERFLAGTLHATTESLNFITGLASRALPQPARDADAIPFPVQVALAHLPLPLSTLQALMVGDVLFPPLSRGDWAQGKCELWSGENLLGLANRQQQTVRILNMKQSIEANPTASNSGPLRVDELPVQVVFDVGQVELSVGQLRTVGEGYTFELPGVPERLVTIRANGREIGQGELVEVGEKVGVRIVSWSLV